MNNKILKIIIGICLLVMLIFYIGAEDNSTDLGNKSLNPEVNVPAQTDKMFPQKYFMRISTLLMVETVLISLWKKRKKIYPLKIFL